MTLDLRQEMHAATAELNPSSDLVARAQQDGRRRLRLRRQWTLGATVAAVALVAFSAANLDSMRANHPERFAPSTATASAIAPPAAVLQAVAEAKTEGTVSGPVEWVRTTSQKVAALSHDGPGSPDIPIYAVHLSGHFVLNSAFVPPGGKIPTGTELVVFIPVASTDQGGDGVLLNDGPIDLSPYGEVHTFQP